MRKIFGKIWAVWGIVFFIVTMLIALLFMWPCAILSEPNKARWHRQVSRVWMHIYLFGIGCPLYIYGREKYDASISHVVVCNHRSLMDVPVTTPFLPKANKTIAKKSFVKAPFFGWIYSWGSVLVDRKDPNSRKNSFFEMEKVIKQWHLDMVLYPEGTRNKTAEPLLPFQKGAFRLAVDTKTVIQPVILKYSQKVLPANEGLALYPHRLELHYLDAISPDNYSTEELKKITAKKMADFLSNN